MHDPNAHYLSQVAGHAGLFGTLESCVRLGRTWLDSLNGKKNGLPENIVRFYLGSRFAQDQKKWGLGWDLPSEQSTAGNISKSGFGHLGYTGTSLWVDPQRNVVAVILTNRVHAADFKEKKEDFKNFRVDIHNLIWNWMDS